MFLSVLIKILTYLSYSSPVGNKVTITMLLVVVVSITGLFLRGGIVKPTPKPQPGGPGVRLGPSSETYPAWLNLSRAQAPRRYSFLVV